MFADSGEGWPGTETCQNQEDGKQTVKLASAKCFQQKYPLSLGGCRCREAVNQLKIKFNKHKQWGRWRWWWRWRWRCRCDWRFRWRQAKLIGLNLSTVCGGSVGNFDNFGIIREIRDITLSAASRDANHLHYLWAFKLMRGRVAGESSGLPDRRPSPSVPKCKWIPIGRGHRIEICTCA